MRIHNLNMGEIYMEKILDTFTPAKAFRNRHLQSIGASIKLRRPLVRKRAAAMLRETSEVIIQCGNDVRLQGFYSPHTIGPRDYLSGYSSTLHHGCPGKCFFCLREIFYPEMEEIPIEKKGPFPGHL